MNLTERQKSILAILKRWRTASVGKLAKTLGVSDASIRRDLIEMQTLGFLDRTHGGAVIAEGAEETSLFLRINENAAEKEQAAANALPHLPRFDSVFFDGSTTALALAARMDLAGKTVMTQVDSAALDVLEGDAADLAATFAGGAPQTISDYNNAFMQLESGMVDAVACDLSIANYQMSAKPDTYTIIDTLSSEHYAVGFKQGDEDLAATVTATLKAMYEDGTVQELCDKYAEYGLSFDNWVLK